MELMVTHTLHRICKWLGYMLWVTLLSGFTLLTANHALSDRAVEHFPPLSAGEPDPTSQPDPLSGAVTPVAFPLPMTQSDSDAGDYLLFGLLPLGIGLALLYVVYQNQRLARLNRQLKEAHKKVAENNALLLEKSRQLERLSITDRLTQIYNRIKLDEEFSQEIQRAERYGQPFSVIMLDVDDFKQINDRHGHAVGDRVLVETAAILKSTIRLTDTLGRWGGEEFFIICPQTGADGAIKLAELLRQRMAHHRFPEAGQLTASFGVAVYQQGERQDDLVRRADKALYQAKRSGKNRVEVVET